MISLTYIKFRKILRLDYPKFPVHLLPQVKEPGFVLAEQCRFLGDSRLIDAKIMTPLGDLQCSVYPCFENDTDCGKHSFINQSY